MIHFCSEASRHVGHGAVDRHGWLRERPPPLRCHGCGLRGEESTGPKTVGLKQQDGKVWAGLIYRYVCIPNLHHYIAVYLCGSE